MAKHNINLLQHQEDVKYLVGDIENGENTTIHYPTDNAKDFYIQSLANMGQRVGSKLTGIKYNSIKIGDIFSDIITNNLDLKAIKITYDDTHTEDEYSLFKVAKVEGVKEDGSIISSGDSTELLSNIYNKYYFENNVEFSVPINNIAKYAKDSIIYNDGNYMIMCLYGQILGTEETDENNVEIQYTKIDVNTGIIESAIRAFCLDELTKTYAMLVLDVESKNEITHQNIYKLSLYITNIAEILSQNVNSSVNTDLLETRIRNAFTWTTCNANLDVNPYNFKYLDNDVTTATIDELLNVAEGYEYDELEHIPKNTIFGLIYNYRTYKNTSLSCTVNFNTQTDTHLSVDETTDDYVNYTVMYNMLVNDVYGIDGRLVCINNDIKFTYPNILSIYSRDKYNYNKNSVFLQIIYKLYENLLKQAESNDVRLYLPVDYVIEYMYNPTDYKIYYTNDIFITFTNLEDYITESEESGNALENELIKNINVPTFVYDGNEKVMCLKFTVKYNDQYEDYIDTILYNEQYTLPYINSSNNWQINDKDSHLSAVGKNAGNPNIIITTTTAVDDEQVGKILVGANYDILKSLTWKIQEYNIDENIIGYAYIPEVSKANMQYLENATIFNIYNVDGIGYTSVWTLGINQYNADNNINIKHEFTYVKDTENNPININSLLGLESSVLDVINNNNLLNINDFDYITIKSYTETFVNSSGDPYNTKDYIRCKIHGELNDTDSSLNDLDYSAGSDNKNDTFLKIEYEKRGASYNNNTEYYLSSINDNRNNITIGEDNISNVNYTKYILEDLSQTNQNTSVYQDSQSNIITTFSNNEEPNSNVGNITEEADQDDIYEHTTNEYVTTEKYVFAIDNELVNEYLPRINVPSLVLNEMLLQDVNTINRSNILSFDSLGYIYNAYIGTSFNDKDKNVLHIGSCAYNINIGTDTLIEPGYNQLFSTHDTLSLDFAYTYINSGRIVQNSFDTVKQSLYGNDYYSISPIVISKRASKNIKINQSNRVEDFVYDFEVENSGVNETEICNNAAIMIEEDKIFQNITIEGTPISGLILLNSLIKRYCNIDINDFVDINLDCEYANTKYTHNNLFSTELGNGAQLFIYNVLSFNGSKYYVYLSTDMVFNELTCMNAPIHLTWYLTENDTVLNIVLNLKTGYLTNSFNFRNGNRSIDENNARPFLDISTDSNVRPADNQVITIPATHNTPSDNNFINTRDNQFIRP